ncbi:hypothetical protein F3Y22_tig00111837pilonHSYRG00046 [Hibiscus syriacus]|uniref:DNA (Cytosine-5)-methyltransferase DRM1/2 n=1 Tax=Hibiscus syriacus TaxID=106335 RepID=A0A6A2XYW9_HIBSY|nr:hypothetical protein F3Y22_tig00111837pilonHSYRG00046 [Hibiscus syriacus]
MISQILIVLSDTEEILNSDSDEENKLLYLTKTGYSEVEASIAMERCDQITQRTLPEDAIGSPYFYYEQIHLSNPMIGFGVYTKPDQITQRTLLEYAIGSPYFYYENVELAPVGAWTEMSCVKLTKRIRKALEAYDESSSSVQKYVLDDCRKWNLVWVGRNKVVPLEPDEVEMLLGFPKNHTRGGGSAKDMFSGGINVLSFFSGISDANVAFYCLGISLKCSRTECDRLEQLMSRFNGLDLVVGGIQCNNLTGRNKHHRDEL